MIRELKLGAKDVGLIVNRAPGGRLSDGVREEIEKLRPQPHGRGAPRRHRL